MSENNIVGKLSLEDQGLIDGIERMAKQMDTLNKRIEENAAMLKAAAPATEEEAAAINALQVQTEALEARLASMEALLGTLPREAQAYAASLEGAAAAEQIAATEADNVTRSFLRASAGMDGMHLSLGGISQSLGDMSTGMVTAGLAAAALGAAMIKASSDAAKYQQDLIQTQNNALMSDQERIAMQNAVEQAAQKSGLALKPLMDGYRQIKDFQFDDAAATKILTTSWQEAASTGAEVDKVTGLVAATLHIYGMSGDQAAAVTNTLQQAAGRANSTFEQFATNSQRAFTVAAQLNVPLEQVTAALATLTRNGYDSAQAQTQVVNIMTHMIHPSQQARDELERVSKATGVDLVSAFSAAGVAQNGLAGNMTLLQQAYQKMGLSEAEATGETMKLLNAQRGGLGQASLMINNGKDFNEILSETSRTMKGELVPVTQNWNRELGTMQNNFDRLGQKIGLFSKDIGTGINDWLLGPILKGIDNIGGAIAKSGNEQAAFTAKVKAGAAETSDSFGLANKAVDSFAGSYAGDAAVARDASAQLAAGVRQATSDIKDSADESTRAARAMAQAHQQALDNINQYLEDNKSEVAKWHTANEGQFEQEREQYNQTRLDLQDQLNQINSAYEQDKQIAATTSGDVQKAAQDRMIAEVNAANKIIGVLADLDGWYKKIAQDALAAARTGNNQSGFAPGAPTMGNGYSRDTTPSQFALGSYLPETNDPTAHTTPIETAAEKRRAASAADKAAKAADNASDAGRQMEEYMNLLRAKQQVAAADKALKDATDQYDNSVNALKTDLDGLKAKEADALGQANALLQQAQAYQQAEAAKSEAAIHGLDVKLHDLNETLKQTKQADADALQPFEFAVKVTTAAVTDLERRIQRMDEAFADRAHVLQDQMYELDQQEKAATAGLDAQIESEQTALDNLQHTASELAFAYQEKLLPLQERLSELQREDTAAQHAEQMHNEQIAIDNLTASLQNATGQERARIQAQLDAARSKMGRENEEYGLQQKIADIQKQQQAEEHSLQLRIHAAQEQLRASEMERKAIMDTFEARKKAIADEQTLLDHQRQEFDYEQGKKLEAAKAFQAEAISQLNMQQFIDQGREQSIQGVIDKIQAQRDKLAWDASEEDRINQGIVKGYQDNYNTIKSTYDAQAKTLDDKITTMERNKDKYLQPFKDAAGAAHDMQTALQEAYGIVEKLDSTNEKGSKTTQDMATALANAQKTIAVIVPQLPHMATNMGLVTTAFTTHTTDVRTDVTQLWDKTLPNSIPGIYKEKMHLLSTDTQTALDWDHFNVWGNEYMSLKDDIPTWMNKVVASSNSAVHASGQSLGEAFKDGFASALTTGDMTVHLSWDVSSSTSSGNPDMPHFASGGIVDRPTVALIGEDGPEAVVPLRGMRSAPYVGAMGGGMGGGLTVNVNVGGLNGVLTHPHTWKPVARAIGIALQDEIRRNGGNSVGNI